MTDSRPANGRVERASGPSQGPAGGRVFCFGAGTPRGAEPGGRVNPWPARSDPEGRFGWAAQRPTSVWAGGSP